MPMLHKAERSRTKAGTIASGTSLCNAVRMSALTTKLTHGGPPMTDQSPKTIAGPPLSGAPGSAFVRVVALAPFWRYAVGPTAAHSPAIPYYRLASAVAFFEEAKRELPWAGVVLYKRRGLRGIEAIREYTPNVRGQAGRAKRVQHATAWRTRPCLHPVVRCFLPARFLSFADSG